MNLICKLSGHKWDYCICSRCELYRDESHNWNGCICRKCSKRRDEGHNWNGCKCRICYKKRNEGHNWDGCKCTICWDSRDEGHQWTGCICKKCRKHAENPVHYWEYDFHGTIDVDRKREISCKNCGKELTLPETGTYCPSCFTKGKWIPVSDGDRMFNKYSFTCGVCGYGSYYEMNDSY